MERTLQSQLSQLPIKRLTTVLRLNLGLAAGEDVYRQASGTILAWCNNKGKRYSTLIGPDDATFSGAVEKFKVEFAQTEDMLAMVLEEPDRTKAFDRDWICDIGLRRVGSRSHIEVRLSYRQPNNVADRPQPRVPRFLREIAEQIGVEDAGVRIASGTRIEGDGVDAFIALLLSPERQLPVIAVSEERGSALVSAAELGQAMAGAAHVYHLAESASWALTEKIGKTWSVYQGAVRCYNAGLEWAGDCYQHRLWQTRQIGSGDGRPPQRFIDDCLLHVFTRDTATFEVLPLLSPVAVRRRTAEQTAALVEATETAEDHPQASPVLEAERVDFGAKLEPEESAVTLATLDNEALQTLKTQVQELQRQLDESVRVQQEQSEHLSSATSLSSSLQTENKTLKERLEREAAENDDLETKMNELRVGYAAEVQLLESTLADLEPYEKLLRFKGEGESLERLRPLWRTMSELFDHLTEIAQEVRSLPALQEELGRLNADNARLLGRLDEAEGNAGDLQGRYGKETQRAEMSSWIKSVLDEKRKLTLEDTLGYIGILYSDRCVVLDEAYKSARQSATFSRPAKAFDLLTTLLNPYWEALASGQGDIVASKCFGPESYASSEGDLNARCRNMRTFDYKGTPLYMESHLKYGVTEGAETLRIHFEWVANERKIVIGHCGKHLNLV